jgi:hypothetical protein
VLNSNPAGRRLAEPVDLARMLVMEFGLVYGADWFFVPIPSAIGVLQQVTTLVVTDTFGFRTLIRPVEQMPVVGGQNPWSMFKISAGDGTPSDFIVLAPTIGISNDAVPIEDVLFLRDDQAALAWAVEQKLAGALDLPVDGYEQYLARLRLDPSATPPTPVAGGTGIAYTVEHAVPDNWIPMLPVLSSSGELLLRRGTMDLPGPGGTVVQLQAHSSILQPGAPYYLTERVVSEIGVDVQKYRNAAVLLARAAPPSRLPRVSRVTIFESSRDGVGHAKGRQRLSPKMGVNRPQIASPSAEKAGTGWISPGKRGAFSCAGRDVSKVATGWWAFLDTYRTNCVAPDHMLRRAFDLMPQFSIAA